MGLKQKIRVRLAPSPTGYLHIGTARTALFNYLFARHQQGKFLLRIEDTDRKRSKKLFEEDIMYGLKWLGLEWDERIIYQSQRFKIYQSYLNKLLTQDQAYYCYCSKERLEKLRKLQTLHRKPPQYDGRCKKYRDKVIKSKWQTIRFDTERFFSHHKNDLIEFKDIIRGKVKFLKTTLDDFVIATQEGVLYNFANVIDDHLMKITHIIRGEDHLSNTPKQIILYQTFKWQPPQFAHLPLILNPDRSKMSKRAGDTHLKDYIKKGYLPQALLNFLALLGWNPKTNQELFSKEELIQRFNLKDVHKGGAVFNLEKLDWFNGKYIRQLDKRTYLKQVKQFLNKKEKDHPQLNQFLLLVKDRIRKFSEASSLISFFFQLPPYKKSLLIWKDTPASRIKAALKIGERVLKRIPHKDFTQQSLQKTLQKTVKEHKLSNGEFFWPLRAALSGQKNSPTPFEILEALGKEESLRRIQEALLKLKDA